MFHYILTFPLHSTLFTKQIGHKIYGTLNIEGVNIFRNQNIKGKRSQLGDPFTAKDYP
jgi:hypothetical protein